MRLFIFWVPGFQQGAILDDSSGVLVWMFSLGVLVWMDVSFWKCFFPKNIPKKHGFFFSLGVASIGASSWDASLDVSSWGASVDTSSWSTSRDVSSWES